jgi:type VI secretion system Hcp family effector
MTAGSKALLTGLAAAGSLALSPALFADDPPFEAWIRFGEDITGESADDGHRDWSDIRSFSATHDEDGFSITCHRPIDKATPLLMAACVDGTTFPEVRIDVARHDNGIRYDFWELSLRDVVITCCGQSSDNESTDTDPVPVESLTLSWKSARVTYRVFPDGSPSYPISRLISADTDSDGLTDAYETEVGLNPSVSNRGIDSDNDGLSDSDECRLGTDPLDGSSFFLVTSTQTDPATGELVLTWPSVPGEEYQIDYSPDLITPFAHHTTVIATGSATTRSVPRQLAAGFFRVTHGEAP